MAKISSLTDNTNDVVYPQTRANAVIMADGTTAEASIATRPKLVLSASEPAGVIDDNTLYGVYGDFGQITSEDISDSAVTSPKLAGSSVTTDKISAGAVTTAKIASGAVTASQLGSSSVTTVKLASNSVTAAKCDWSTFLNKIYPVGSIYMSVSHTSASAVATALGGGTWVAWGAGRVPLGMGSNGTTNYTTVEATGGEEKHQLTAGELPKLSGEGQFKPYDSFSTSGIVAGRSWAQTKNFSAQPGLQSASTIYGFTISFGNNEKHENRQPYITVYMWKRTA